MNIWSQNVGHEPKKSNTGLQPKSYNFILTDCVEYTFWVVKSVEFSKVNCGKKQGSFLKSVYASIAAQDMT
jgi:hypothetical protein